MEKASWGVGGRGVRPRAFLGTTPAAALTTALIRQYQGHRVRRGAAAATVLRSLLWVAAGLTLLGWIDRRGWQEHTA